MVQLYLRDLYSSVARPIKELKAFKKIQLKAGEVKTVSLNVPAEAMSFTGRDLQKVIEPGTFVVMVGTNSSEFIETSFEVK